MRIIAGNRKGQRLTALKGTRTRPTQDRVREAIFNILEQQGIFTNIADLFAGTGAMGLEALSRWSGRVLFVDSDRGVIENLRQNIRRLKFEAVSQVAVRDLSRGVGFLIKMGAPFDLILVDPPYLRGWGQRIVEGMLTESLLTDQGLLVLEHDQKETVPERVPGGLLADQRRYGQTLISFYRRLKDEST
jgi:16S rRNA (guanine(966)-N(2))-methyltransferase RsmD